MRSSTFEVLAEPRRRQILDVLSAGEQTVGALVRTLGISQPAVSKHLRVLREAELVAARADAQRRLYHVRPERLREIDAWLAPYRRMWSRSLERLEGHLEQVADDSPPAGTPARRQPRERSSRRRRDHGPRP
jgi:DNA-binding transcriptional ArsR family regulator